MIWSRSVNSKFFSSNTRVIIKYWKFALNFDVVYRATSEYVKKITNMLFKTINEPFSDFENTLNYFSE